MMVVMIATVRLTTMTAAATEAAIGVNSGAMKAAVLVEIRALVETVRDPKADPDTDRNGVAVSGIGGVRGLGVSVVGLVLRRIRQCGGSSREAVGIIGGCNLCVLGGLRRGLVEVIIEINAVRGLGRCGFGDRPDVKSEDGSCYSGVFERHWVLLGFTRIKRNGAVAYSRDGQSFLGVSDLPEEIIAADRDR
jgi:hypothetical protein